MTYRISPCDFLCRGVRIGASVIDCWQPRDNSHAWYSVRLTSRRSTPLLTRVRSNEESQLPKQAMPAGANSRFQKHHSATDSTEPTAGASSISLQYLLGVGAIPARRKVLQRYRRRSRG